MKNRSRLSGSRVTGVGRTHRHREVRKAAGMLEMTARNREGGQGVEFCEQQARQQPPEVQRPWGRSDP